jgi:MFS family permease
MAIAGLGTSVSSLLLATIAVAGAAGLGFMGVMMMAAIYGPARSLFSQELVLPRWRTTTSAILTIGMALGSACTTAGGGFVISTVRFGGLFAVSAGPAACSAVLEYQSPARRAAHGAPTALGGQSADDKQSGYETTALAVRQFQPAPSLEERWRQAHPAVTLGPEAVGAPTTLTDGLG